MLDCREKGIWFDGLRSWKTLCYGFLTTCPFKEKYRTCLCDSLLHLLMSHEHGFLCHKWHNASSLKPAVHVREYLHAFIRSSCRCTCSIHTLEPAKRESNCLLQHESVSKTTIYPCMMHDRRYISSATLGFLSPVSVKEGLCSPLSMKNDTVAPRQANLHFGTRKRASLRLTRR